MPQNHLELDIHIVPGPVDPIRLLRKLSTNRVYEDDHAFYMVNLDDVLHKYNTWLRVLPRVKFYYAVKCNEDPIVLKLLDYLGAGFDCSSKIEINKILDLGVSPERIIYAHPCKQVSYLRYAFEKKVNLMTFDNDYELFKIKEHHSNAKIVLRLMTDDTNAAFKLSQKFGANMDESYKLIDLAVELGLDLVGISFHVGSGQMSSHPFREPIENCRVLFDYVKNTYNRQMTLLDIGGGYPGLSESLDLFETIAKDINETIDKHFPSDIEIIGEPGAYLVHSAFTLSCNVIGKRLNKKNDGEKSFMYYLNDGVFGGFNLLLHQKEFLFEPILTKAVSNDMPSMYDCSLWGPTLDGTDRIRRNIQLPELEIGDNLAFKNIGSYTISVSTTFNGRPIPKSIYTITE